MFFAAYLRATKAAISHKACIPKAIYLYSIKYYKINDYNILIIRFR